MKPVWITNGTQRPFYARKRIETEKRIVKAVAQVCGLGQFNFYVNGRKVGDHVLDPGWTDYNKLVQYVTFDITDLLRPGANALAAEVGNGWYCKNDEGYTFRFPGFMPPNPNPYRPFGPCLVLAVAVTLTDAEGRETVITTGPDWKTAPHPVVASNVYGSETIDHRLAQPGWSDVDFDDSKWTSALSVREGDGPKGVLVPQNQSPVRVIRTWTGRCLHTVNGRRIYDLGQNLSGMLCIRLKGRRGEEVRVFPAEKLGADGDVDQMAKNWVLIDTRVVCVLGSDDEWETFDSTFTYIAGRYLAVEGEAQIGEVSAQAITSAWKADGAFECDDERYNRIYAMIERTVEANLLSVHTDCPTIERFAWQEPNHLMAPSIFYMKDGRKLWEKFLTDMRAAQITGEEDFRDMDGRPFRMGAGLMPSQAPCYVPNVLPVPGMGSFYDIIPWGSTCILGAWWHYWFYGDAQVLRDNYAAGMRYLDYLKTCVNADGFINHGLGDWGNPERQYARENVETAFLYADAATLAKMAKVLEREADAEALLRYAQAIRDNYNEKLLEKNPETGRWSYRMWEAKERFRTTQACQALPLYWGMVPPEKRRDVEEELRRTLTEKNAFVSGEIGLPYIIQAAAQCGMDELIAAFITRPEHPSYYAFVLEGETTLGEYWETNPRSHCHDMMGHIVEWFYNGLAGIVPEAPGFARVRIRPFLPESIHHLCCAYRSASGTIRLEIDEGETEIALRVHAPENVELHFDLSRLEGRGKRVAASRD